MISEKYWIDEKGNIAEVSDRHILQIALHPEQFGLTKKYVADVHRKHKEKIGSEGNAREEILVKLMDRGWIRLRYVRRDNSWGIQVSEKSETPYKGRLKSWANFIMNESAYAGNAAVKIINLVPALIEPEMSVAEVAAGGLSQKRKYGRFAEFLNPSGRYGTVRRRKK